MKSALYHLDGGQSKVLDVVGKNDDGTFNLGKDNKVLVSSVKLEKEPKVGSATEAPVERPAKAEKAEGSDKK